MGALDRRGFNRRVLLGGAAVATSLSLAPEARSDAGPAQAAPGGGEVRRIKLYAEKRADGQMGYGLEKGSATIPGPQAASSQRSPGDAGRRSSRRSSVSAICIAGLALNASA